MQRQMAMGKRLWEKEGFWQRSYDVLCFSVLDGSRAFLEIQDLWRQSGGFPKGSVGQKPHEVQWQTLGPAGRSWNIFVSASIKVLLAMKEKSVTKGNGTDISCVRFCVENTWYLTSYKFLKNTTKRFFASNIQSQHNHCKSENETSGELLKTSGGRRHATGLTTPPDNTTLNNQRVS